MEDEKVYGTSKGLPRKANQTQSGNQRASTTIDEGKMKRFLAKRFMCCRIALQMIKSIVQIFEEVLNRVAMWDISSGH